MYNNPWLYNNTPFDGPIKGYEGFVYLITNLTNNRRYIGKKHFWTRQKPKGQSRRVTKESDWRNYYSSSDNLKADIKLLGIDNFKREILYLCVYKKEMSYNEESEQWKNNVLLDDNWYNTNIGGRYFVRERKIYSVTHREVTTKNDKWREIKSEQMKGDNNVAKRADVRKKISEKKSGEKHHQFGKPISDNHKQKLHDAAHEKRKRKVIHNEIEYNSATEFIELNNMSISKFYTMLKNNTVEYSDGNGRATSKNTKKWNFKEKIYNSMTDLIKECHISTDTFYKLVADGSIKNITL